MKAVEPFPGVVAMVAALGSLSLLPAVVFGAYAVVALVVWQRARSAAARARPPATQIVEPSV